MLLQPHYTAYNLDFTYSRIEIKPIEFKYQSYFVAGLVFDFASPPTNSSNTEAVYNNAKEFMKSSATIQAQYIY